MNYAAFEGFFKMLVENLVFLFDRHLFVLVEGFHEF